LGPGWKSLAGTNLLVYLASLSETKKKKFYKIWTRFEAADACEEMGGQLPEILSRSENDQIANLKVDLNIVQFGATTFR
jgi:hypothetical protein